MPGLKTKKGVAKRFKLTKRKKIKYQGCGKSHLNSGKSAKRLRKMRKGKMVEHTKNDRFIKRMLPYG